MIHFICAHIHGDDYNTDADVDDDYDAIKKCCFAK